MRLCKYCKTRTALYKHDHCGADECRKASGKKQRQENTAKAISFNVPKSRPIDPESREWQRKLLSLEVFYAVEMQKPVKDRLSISDLGMRSSEKEPQ